MKDSIFSKNELNYLRDKNTFSKNHSKNHIYQIRHSIREKVENFIFRDLELLLKNNPHRNNKTDLINDKILEYSVLQLLKHYPYFILKILNLTEVKDYLGSKKS